MSNQPQSAVSGQSERRVRTDQPTIVTLEETMAEAKAAALKSFRGAGFTHVVLVINVVATSRDPDGDVTTWAAGSRVDGGRSYDRQMLASSMRRSADEADDV